jgi:hypothetical protein
LEKGVKVSVTTRESSRSDAPYSSHRQRRKGIRAAVAPTQQRLLPRPLRHHHARLPLRLKPHSNQRHRRLANRSAPHSATLPNQGLCGLGKGGGRKTHKPRCVYLPLFISAAPVCSSCLCLSHLPFQRVLFGRLSGFLRTQDRVNLGYNLRYRLPRCGPWKHSRLVRAESRTKLLLPLFYVNASRP